jgi:hypothetical protein
MTAKKKKQYSSVKAMLKDINKRPTVTRIPIKAAREVAQRFDQDQVILITFGARPPRTHVVTFGKTLTDKAMAARFGNKLKRSWGWTEDLCCSVPAAVRHNPALVALAVPSSSEKPITIRSMLSQDRETKVAIDPLSYKELEALGERIRLKLEKLTKEQ